MESISQCWVRLDDIYASVDFVRNIIMSMVIVEDGAIVNTAALDLVRSLFRFEMTAAKADISILSLHEKASQSQSENPAPIGDLAYCL
jgi:hypothetical protein